MRFDRFFRAARAAIARLGFGLTGLAVLLLGAVTFVGSVAVFGGATEDVAQHNGLALHDAANLREFTDHRSALVVHLSKFATDLGAFAVIAVLAFVASVLLWRRGLRLALALAPIASFGVAAVAVAVTKNLVGRARPPVALHLVSESDASFPSGHATDSAAVLLSIAFVVAVFVLRRPIMRVVAVLAAAFLTGAIGASRLVLGVHWPSDVLAGWALGLSAAVLVTMSAAVIVRLAPPSANTPESRVRRVSWRVREWLTLERQPRGDLRAA